MNPKEQSKSMANTMMAQFIYDGLRLDGCDLTLSDVETVLNLSNHFHSSKSYVEMIVNLSYAWRYMLDVVPRDINPDRVYRTCNGIQSFKEIPRQRGKLDTLQQIVDPKERAAEYFCWAMKRGIDKRSALIITNAILIQGGAGVFTIDKDNESFLEVLELLKQDDKPLKYFIEHQIELMSKQFLFEQEQGLTQ